MKIKTMDYIIDEEIEIETDFIVAKHEVADNPEHMYLENDDGIFYEVSKEIADEISIRIIVDGRFIEGSYVTVNIDGREYTRKVFYNRNAGDLAIRANHNLYLYCEFN